jgi:formylglycine-generating enzyme required for sulfatase activity
MKFVLVTSGKFLMGSTRKEQDDAIADYEKNAGKKASETTLARYRAEGPRHEVKITKDFYLGAYEVTQGQWKAVMGNNPSFYGENGNGNLPVNFSVKDLDDFPVELVSWEDTQEFLKKLNALAAEKKLKVEYRLPTEAEWEYACRGGPRPLPGRPRGRGLLPPRPRSLEAFS